jgi:hypothetical protein
VCEARTLSQEPADFEVGANPWLDPAEELQNEIMAVGDRGVGLLGFQEMRLANCRARRPNRGVGTRDRADYLTPHSMQMLAMLDHA